LQGEGLSELFRIKAEDHLRELAGKAILTAELNDADPCFRLVASSGFNYLHVSGKMWNSGLGDALMSDKATISCVLQSPDSDFAVARALANGVKDHHWALKPGLSSLKMLHERKNVEIRVTRHPINCSLFFTKQTALYDPYLWGKLKAGDATENNFWVFRFERMGGEGKEAGCYQLLQSHFEFLLSNSVPFAEVMRSWAKVERNFKRKLQQFSKDPKGYHG
jgi:hypothetical protein